MGDYDIDELHSKYLEQATLVEKYRNDLLNCQKEPVEKIVYKTQYVDKPVEKIVYKTKYVDKPVEKIVYKTDKQLKQTIKQMQIENKKLKNELFNEKSKFDKIINKINKGF